MEKKAWVAMGAVALMAVPVLGLAGEKNDNNPFERLWDAIAQLEERLDSSDDVYVTSADHEADVASLQGQIDSLACRMDGGEGCAGEDEGEDDGDDEGSGSDDEGYLKCGTGACANAVPKVIDGVPQECVPLPPQIEMCDAIDNDCDGESDEDIEGLNESCAGGAGVLACSPDGGGVICKTW
jgi:hypothetical protein